MRVDSKLYGTVLGAALVIASIAIVMAAIGSDKFPAGAFICAATGAIILLRTWIGPRAVASAEPGDAPDRTLKRIGYALWTAAALLAFFGPALFSPENLPWILLTSAVLFLMGFSFVRRG
ncbi:MAG: hypothetical protein WDM79_18885 [Terricaulis sp.]